MNIINLFEHQVDTNPDAVALTYKSEKISYSELNQKVNKLAHYLVELGCKPNTVVAVCMEKSPDLFISMLAIIKVGGVYLPINENQSLEYLHDTLANSKAKILLSRSHLQDKVDFFQGKSIFIDQAIEIDTKSFNNLPRNINTDEPACLFYSMLSSNPVLGIMVSHKNIINYAEWLRDLTKLNNINRIEFSTNISISFSLTTSLVPLILGWHISICPDEIKSDFNLYLKFLGDEQISLINLATPYFYALLDEVLDEKVQLLNLKYIVLNDTKLLTGCCLNWLNIYPQHIIFNMYGKQETTNAATCFSVTIENVAWLPEHVPLGKPGPNIECKLTENSELEIGGACVTDGYLHHEKETKEKFYDETVKWFKTSDICKLDKNSNLIYVGALEVIEPTVIISKAEISPPQNELENLVLSVWMKEFNIDNISMKDNFFELGGHSLNASRILTKLERLTGKRIYLQDIYTAPTPFELTKVVETSQSIIEVNQMKASTNKKIPLTDFQFMFWIASLYEERAKKLNVLTRKRFNGNIDMPALEYACNKLLQKQQILCYRFLKFKPIQEVDRVLPSPLVYTDLSQYSENEQEAKLIKSMDELAKFYPWESTKPNLIVRLFKLNKVESEIQLCMPHIVADDYSLELLYKDLSAFYNNYKNDDGGPFALAQFKDYVIYESSHFNRNLERDRDYWEKNLENSILFPFPKKFILSEAEADSATYSTYLQISDETMQKVRKTCFKNKINIAHAFSAAMALVLYGYLENEYREKDIYFSIVKSMRDDEIFDNVIGCMLTTDAFKIKINPNLKLVELAHRIQNEMIANAPYQNCSGMLKLASVYGSIWKKHPLLSYFVKSIATLYTKLFPKLRLNPIVMNSYVRLGFFRSEQMFLLNINLWGNFVSGQNKQLFGYQQIDLPLYKFDLTNIKTVLDITFMRDDYNKTYLVLSGNLKPGFREKLAKEVAEKLMSF